MRRIPSTLVLVSAAALTAQGPGRIATTPEALVASAVFFHGKQVAVRAGVVEKSGLQRLEPSAGQPASERSIYVYWQDRPGSGDGEIRGEFWDLGRLTENDARFSNYDFRTLLDAVNNGRWPPRDQVFVILGASRVASPVPAAPTVRAIAMAPGTYAGRTVTVSGRFRGRNLYGDVPMALNKSKWDFVMQSADAAVWVTGIRPRGKGFDLDPGARVDTGRWIEVAGVVRNEGSRVWLEGTTIQLSSAPAETPVEIAVAPPKEPPPTVVFSAPIPDETDVNLTTTIRLQFSRDMDGRTIRDRVRATYAPSAQGQAPPAPVFSATYNEGLRALEIKFAKPLERFQKVTIELLEGITATDGQPLQPWTLVFTTGAR